MARRVVVLSFLTDPPASHRELVARLREAGDELVVVGMRAAAWEDVASPQVTVHDVGPFERLHRSRRIPHILIQRAPVRALERAGLKRWAPRYRRISQAVERRGYMRVYGLARRHVLATVADRRISPLLPPDVDVIVALDTLSVNYGHHLARRYPAARATTDVNSL